MCEAYTPMICKKCGMSHHYPAKTPNTTQLPDWHCSAKKRPKCGMEARQNGGQFSTLRRYRGKPWTLASCWCSRPRSGCGNAKPRRSGKPAWKPPKRPQGVRTGETLVTYRQGLKTLYGRFGASMDVSKADYMIGVDMARRGFSPDQIGQAIEQASPELPTRKAGHEADYVARTVKAVFNHPEVVKQEQAKEAQQRSNKRERDSCPSLGL